MKFKPQINEIITSFDMSPILLIPKNRGLKDIVSKTLYDMGVKYLEFDKNSDGSYTNGKLTVSVYRGEDIPKLVEDLYFDKRIKAIGFTGDDLFDEYILKTSKSIMQVFETIDWYDPSAMFGRPALCLISRSGESPEGDVNIALNRKYECTSKRYLEESAYALGINPRINIYSGNTESTVSNGINDLCIEIVYTGNSIKQNNLEIKDRVRFSDFVVIGINEKSSLAFQRDYESIQKRKLNPTDSLTTKLLDNPNKAIKKLGEEYSEFLREIAMYENMPDKASARENIALEFGQLFYTMALNAVRCDVNLEDITKSICGSLTRC